MSTEQEDLLNIAKAFLQIRNIRHIKEGETFIPKNQNSIVISCGDAVNAEIITSILKRGITSSLLSILPKMNELINKMPDGEERREAITSRNIYMDNYCVLSGLETEEEIDEARRRETLHH